ncbi:short-chain dehydrogenases/reductase [Trametes punicea]|nr:short-chain dehydrogenases/reductase [Trametes punicea]
MPSYVVTGASRGIGLEFVNQFTRDTTTIVFGLVRNPQSSRKLLELQKSRPNLHVLKADITDVPSLKAAAAKVAKGTGGWLDCLINNAAKVYNNSGPGLTLTTYTDEKVLEEDLMDMFRINVIGVIHTINAFLPLLRAGTAKKVIALSSGIADNDLTLKAGIVIQAPYGISKAGLNVVIAKYAAELRPEGFTFLSLSPELVNTAEKPPTPEEQEVFQGFVTRLQHYAPHWNGKAITPEMSVKLLLDIIERSTVKYTGAFLSHWGNKQWL